MAIGQIAFSQLAELTQVARRRKAARPLEGWRTIRSKLAQSFFPERFIWRVFPPQTRHSRPSPEPNRCREVDAGPPFFRSTGMRPPEGIRTIASGLPNSL